MSIQQRRSQLQEELKKLDEEEKQASLQEKQQKLQHFNSLVTEYQKTYHAFELYRLGLEQKKNEIQDYLRKNPEVDDSVYHTLIRNFISRIKKLTYERVQYHDYGRIWVYDFTFCGVKYHREIHSGTETFSKVLDISQVSQDLVPTKDEQVAAELLDIKLKPYLDYREKSYW